MNTVYPSDYRGFPAHSQHECHRHFPVLQVRSATNVENHRSLYSRRKDSKFAVRGLTQNADISSLFSTGTCKHWNWGNTASQWTWLTLTEGIYEMAEDRGWIKVEWFKLHLRPNTATTREMTQKLPPLPPNKQAAEVLADFLRYMYTCVQTYIEESHPNGAASVESEIQFILTHPNGWEGIQQTQMREAAVRAGLIPDMTAGRSRIAFVTEGEASLHFAIRHGLPVQATQTDDGVVIVDAGGGTIDVSAYSRTSNTVRQLFEEIAQPQCHFHGSVFVSILCRLFLEGFLAESDFLEDLDHIVQCFDKTTKLQFRRVEEPQFVKFGSTRDNDENCNIRYGQLKITGTDVASFFEPSIQCIIDSVQEQRKKAHKKFTHVVLVGG